MMTSTSRSGNSVRFEERPPPAFFDTSEEEDDSEDEEEERQKPSSTTNTNDKEIEALYETAPPPKKKRTPRPKLTEEQLTGSTNGLLAVLSEFSRTLKAPQQRSLPAAAAYARQLTNLYQQWASDLLPAQNAADNLLKVEQLGAKKSVKQYLQLQRNEWCRNRHLERVLGKDKAEELLHQYEDYVVQQQRQQNEEEEGLLPSEPPAPPNRDGALLSEPAAAAATTRGAAVRSEEAPAATTTAEPQRKRKRVVLEDTDDEEEMEFDGGEEDGEDGGSSDKEEKDPTMENERPKEEEAATDPSYEDPVLMETDDEDDVDGPTTERMEDPKEKGSAIPHADDAATENAGNQVDEAAPDEDEELWSDAENPKEKEAVTETSHKDPVMMATESEDGDFVAEKEEDRKEKGSDTVLLDDAAATAGKEATDETALMSDHDPNDEEAAIEPATTNPGDDKDEDSLEKDPAREKEDEDKADTEMETDLPRNEKDPAMDSDTEPSEANAANIMETDKELEKEDTTEEPMNGAATKDAASGTPSVEELTATSAKIAAESALERPAPDGSPSSSSEAAMMLCAQQTLSSTQSSLENTEAPSHAGLSGAVDDDSSEEDTILASQSLSYPLTSLTAEEGDEH